MDAVVFLVPIISVISFCTMIVFLRRYENIERMSMIERGMNPADMKLWARRKDDPFRAMRIACAAIGIGVGLFAGNVLRSIGFFDRGGIVAGLVLICGGIGLIVGYFIQVGLQNKKPNERSVDVYQDTDIL